jgi:hypothetical protein
VSDVNVDLSQVTAVFDTAGSLWVDARVWGVSPSGIRSTVYAAAPPGGCGAAVATIVWAPNGNLSVFITPPNAPPHENTSPLTAFSNGRFAVGVNDSGLTGITAGCVSVKSFTNNAVATAPVPAPHPTRASRWSGDGRRRGCQGVVQALRKRRPAVARADRGRR